MITIRSYSNEKRSIKLDKAWNTIITNSTYRMIKTWTIFSFLQIKQDHWKCLKFISLWTFWTFLFFNHLIGIDGCVNKLNLVYEPSMNRLYISDWMIINTIHSLSLSSATLIGHMYISFHCPWTCFGHSTWNWKAVMWKYKCHGKLISPELTD